MFSTKGHPSPHSIKDGQVSAMPLKVKIPLNFCFFASPGRCAAICGYILPTPHLATGIFGGKPWRYKKRYNSPLILFCPNLSSFCLLYNCTLVSWGYEIVRNCSSLPNRYFFPSHTMSVNLFALVKTATRATQQVNVRIILAFLARSRFCSALRCLAFVSHSFLKKVRGFWVQGVYFCVFVLVSTTYDIAPLRLTAAKLQRGGIAAAQNDPKSKTCVSYHIDHIEKFWVLAWHFAMIRKR